MIFNLQSVYCMNMTWCTLSQSGSSAQHSSSCTSKLRHSSGATSSWCCARLMLSPKSARASMNCTKGCQHTGWALNDLPLFRAMCRSRCSTMLFIEKVSLTAYNCSLRRSYFLAPTNISRMQCIVSIVKHSRPSMKVEREQQVYFGHFFVLLCWCWIIVLFFLVTCNDFNSQLNVCLGNKCIHPACNIHYYGRFDIHVHQLIW